MSKKQQPNEPDSAYAMRMTNKHKKPTRPKKKIKLSKKQQRINSIKSNLESKLHGLSNSLDNIRSTVSDDKSNFGIMEGLLEDHNNLVNIIGDYRLLMFLEKVE